MTNPSFGSQESVAHGERNLRSWRIIGAIVVLLLIAGNIIWAQYITVSLNRTWAPVISVTDPVIIDSNVLCPGDLLTYEYTLHSQGSGVIDVDKSVWAETPPQTAIYSTPERAILIAETNTAVREAWPKANDTLGQDLLRSAPGNYELRLAFRNVYEATKPEIIRVPFEISGDCP